MIVDGAEQFKNTQGGNADGSIQVKKFVKSITQQ